ncbi:MAG: M28 family peptidase [Fidelibacterota bacterium]
MARSLWITNYASRITHYASSLLLLLLPILTLAQEVPKFDGNRAFTFLEQQSALGPRNPGSKGHEKGLQYILDVVSPLADSVILQPFSYSDPYSGALFGLTNVVARFLPHGADRIWLAAHWDTRPWADRDRNWKNRKKPIVGANDGASGVAVLLELAHHLSERPPPMGVDLIFLDGEDLGKSGDLDHFFNGARYLARHIPVPVPQYCILLDMVGDKELELPIEGNSWLQAPQLVQELWNLAQDLGLSAFQSRIAYSVADDHVVIFEEGGIPSVDIIDFDYPNKRTNYWHTLEDTPDKCSPRSLETVGTLLLHHIYGMP